uniref:Mitochondrial carrier protein n=1 Tax=Clastoptera arizonana TaxID=38151 RepID=A0A1B6DT30_9HEMI
MPKQKEVQYEPMVMPAPTNTTQMITDFVFGEMKEFTCGCGAALINITITFPLNKVIFRQMLHNVGIGNAIKQIKTEGFLYLYRGVLPPLCQKSLCTALMFGVYDKVRKPFAATNLHPTFVNAIAAFSAGTTEISLLPFERVQTLLQDQRYHKKLKNTKHAFYLIYIKYGVKEYYRGLVPVLFRNGPSNVLFFYLRDEASLRLPKPVTVVAKTFKEFLIGASIGAFGSTVFYPLNIIKVHMQSRLGGPFQSFWLATKHIYIERNSSIRGFYRGVHMNYTRSFISWGVINVAYEQLKKIVY